MPIFANISRPVKLSSRFAPGRRPLISRPSHPFGQGLVPRFEVTENPEWAKESLPSRMFRFMMVFHRADGTSEFQGFDFEHEANAYGRYLEWLEANPVDMPETPETPETPEAHKAVEAVEVTSQPQAVQGNQSPAPSNPPAPVSPAPRPAPTDRPRPSQRPTPSVPPAHRDRPGRQPAQPHIRPFAPSLPPRQLEPVGQPRDTRGRFVRSDSPEAIREVIVPGSGVLAHQVGQQGRIFAERSAARTYAKAKAARVARFQAMPVRFAGRTSPVRAVQSAPQTIVVANAI
jgi:hypothetical protein